MSLVEQALKKMQSVRGAAAPKPVPALGAAAPARVPPGAESGNVAARPAQPPPEPIRPTRIVQVDRVALRAAGVLPLQAEEQLLAREYRQIKRPLIANALGRGVPRLPNGHLIMLASALPGDGKTFTSVNLALSLALEKDVRTLLVDADVAKPHISRIFGVEGEPGLLDLLREEQTDIESVILPTDVRGLSILPAGRPSETATELLASGRMETIIAQIGARDAGRIALFDSPPLLLTTESRALAGVVGQIVLVVNAGTTPQHAVTEALELLGDGKSIGLVLNQCDEGSRKGYYRYYGQQENASAGD